MRLQLNTSNLKESRQGFWLLIDLLMLGLLILNLVWLVFDWLFVSEGFRDFLATINPDLVDAYAPIHRNFFFYDLYFVAIFLTEFMVRWIYAALTREYKRWYFYPFAHWYDLLGCIPVTGFRFLRMLRIISIFYRLQKYQIIDFTSLKAYQFLRFYYEAFMEEISDRVVIKVLAGTQEELRSGSPLLHRIQQEVLLPRKPLLVSWLSEKVAHAAQHAYLPHRHLLQRYIAGRLDQAIRDSDDIKRLKLIPVVGTTLSSTLERAVSDIVVTTIDQILRDLASTENHQFIEDLTEVFLHEKPYEKGDLDEEIIQACIELLELVKDQVHVKRWHAHLDPGNNQDLGASSTNTSPAGKDSPNKLP